MRHIKGLILIGLAALLLGTAVSCGGRVHKAPAQGAVPLEPKAYTLQDALAELDALEKPEGVDEKVWEELKGALREALMVEGRGFTPRRFVRNPDGGPQVAALQQNPEWGKNAPPPGEDPEPGWSARRTLKLISSPPTGPANKVNDLTATRETNGDFTLSWHYRNLGDYDQNGAVGVSDITPLAQHFGETYDAQTEGDSIQAVIDGSGNAKIGVEDVTQIAQNFGVAVAKYSVRGSDAYAGPFAETTIIGVSPQVSDARKVLTMNLGASPVGYWQVVPQDAENAQGEASNVAGISLQIRSVTPTEVKEGTVVTFSADVLGAGPFTYEWDFGGQAVPSTSTEASPKAVLTRDTGDFPARLTVTNHLGNAAYPFTLSKLAREWKYEVVPANIGGFRGLKIVNGVSWFMSSKSIPFGPTTYTLSSFVDGIVTTHYVGPCGLFDIRTDGEVAVLGFDGYLVDFSMYYLRLENYEWVSELVAPELTLNFGEFAFSWNGIPLVVYENRDWDPETFDYRYAWRTQDGWNFGIIDDAGGPGGIVKAPLGLSIGNSGVPGTCYRVARNPGESPTYYDLRFASCDDPSYGWATSVIASEQEGADLDVGMPADVAYSEEGQPGAAYAHVCLDPYLSIWVKRITLAKRNGTVWDYAVVRQWADNTDVYSLSLCFSPLGESLVLYPIENSETGVQLCLSRQDVSSFEEEVIAAGVNNGNLYIDEIGNPYVLYRDTIQEEVIIARYE